MGKLELFLKSNKKKVEQCMYPATESLRDENGEVLNWILKPVTTKASEKIREACTKDVPVPGNRGIYRQKFDSNLFVAKIICAAVVEPDLNNKELQDSYEVMTPEELIQEMVDNPAEYNKLAEYVQNMSGMDKTMDDEVEEAKNS